jgi:superfamily II DNA helicase RecQ
MGIDCRDVGLVISFLHTRSVTDWIQDIGRAGRNGEPSAGFLLYSSTQLSALHMMRPDEKKLHTFLKLCQQDICRRKLLFDAIEELDVNREYPAALHLCCDNCRPKCKCTLCIAGKYQFPWPEFGMQRNENNFIARAQSFIGAKFNVEFDNKS